MNLGMSFRALSGLRGVSSVYRSRSLVQSKSAVTRLPAQLRHASFYNADIAGLTEEQAEV
jgi:hypothetical protein